MRQYRTALRVDNNTRALYKNHPCLINRFIKNQKIFPVAHIFLFPVLRKSVQPQKERVLLFIKIISTKTRESQQRFEQTTKVSVTSIPVNKFSFFTNRR